ncbi:peroxisomal membrane protein 11B-like [Oppia nitens]|uniref:peroxisomal membrane protein 11B-like n=1 Tax=Oppia nitens TaxID=1686743 RepID=UPI0023DACE53|nr:peroxisomal membrane protein 11B-like [Oppia nitens]XP_054160136.1 peroxisomal membrane protein 11B-like [Oppia nitens]
MDSLIRFNAQTTGREKLLRLCQFTSRMVWSLLMKYKPNDESIDKFQDLESKLSSSRKLLRLGRCIDALYSSLQTMHLPDPTLRVTLTVSRIANSLYLLCDHMVWLASTGLISVNGKQWSEWSNKFWLYSIAMNLTRDIYEISNILKFSLTFNKNNINQNYYYEHSSRFDGNQTNLINSSKAQYLKIIEWIIKHKIICIDTFKNFCDLWIPLTSLGHTKLSPQTIGFLGLFSSLIAILQIYNYSYRLSPS